MHILFFFEVAGEKPTIIFHLIKVKKSYKNGERLVQRERESRKIEMDKD
jgi:hypothetical protein